MRRISSWLLALLALLPAALRAGSREYPFVFENDTKYRANIVVQEKGGHTYTVSIAAGAAHSCNAGFAPGTAGKGIERIKIDGVSPEKWFYAKDMKDSQGRSRTGLINTPWQFRVTARSDSDWTVETYVPAPAENPNDQLTVFSLNTYCFPQSISDALWKASKKALMSGMRQNRSTRIAKIAALAVKQQPDVIQFQELWGADNKKEMIDRIMEQPGGKDYRYIFWNDEHQTLRPFVLDDGLLVLSRRRPFMERKIIYTARHGDEDMPVSISTAFQQIGAEKGALILGYYSKDGKAILLADTHMNSGTHIDAVETKRNQLNQLADELIKIQKTDPRTADAQFIIGGDFNEAVCWRTEPVNRIADRTKWMTDAYNKKGIPVSNQQMIKFLASNLQPRPQEVVDVNELDMRSVVKDLSGNVRYTLVGKGVRFRNWKPDGSVSLDVDPAPSYRKAVELLDKKYQDLKDKNDLSLSYSLETVNVPGVGKPGDRAPQYDNEIQGRHGDAGYAYFPFATEPSGTQVLDHFFVNDKRSEIVGYRVMRRETLGDEGKLCPVLNDDGNLDKDHEETQNGKKVQVKARMVYMDSAISLTDHAAIMATFRTRR